MTVRSSVEHEVKKKRTRGRNDQRARKEKQSPLLHRQMGLRKSGWIREKAALFAPTIGGTPTAFQAHSPPGTNLLVSHLNWKCLAREFHHRLG
jgi:hypothetical protein